MPASGLKPPCPRSGSPAAASPDPSATCRIKNVGPARHEPTRNPAHRAAGVSSLGPHAFAHLLRPQDRLAVGERDAHTLADHVRVFAWASHRSPEKRISRQCQRRSGRRRVAADNTLAEPKQRLAFRSLSPPGSSLPAYVALAQAAGCGLTRRAPEGAGRPWRTSGPRRVAARPSGPRRRLWCPRTAPHFAP